jgi:hypothetical protein
MLPLPPDMIALLMLFAPLFSQTVFPHAQVLLVGALLAPGKRTVSSALRAMGLALERGFQTYHRVLNRARWSSRQAAAILLRLLVDVFVPTGRLPVGLDETLERRKGKRIAAKGIYRDAARSSKEYLTKVSALRWMTLMLLAPIPWAQAVWALPFLTVLAPSERYHQVRGQRHKTLAVWARQMLGQLRRWLPEREIVAVADHQYAVLALLAHCIALPRPVHVVTRLRLDAGLYAPAPPREPSTIGRPAVKGPRLPKLERVLSDPRTVWRSTLVARWYRHRNRPIEIVSDTAVWYRSGEGAVPIRWVLIRDPWDQFRPQALLCTDVDATPEQLVGWFVHRWRLETTYEEVRAHLGVETQRQWNELAIARTTPVLMGLFSLVTLLAHRQHARGALWVRQAAWYVKDRPTFSDAIASVRRELWPWALSLRCASEEDREKLPLLLLERFADTLCYAA